jgi:hypothetical protein
MVLASAFVPLLLAAASGPWSKSFSPPKYKASSSSSGAAGKGGDSFVLAPVSIERNDLDYDAVMANRPHLAATLGLKYDFDHLMYENWRDLLEAQDNFEARSAYAFAVLDPARTKSLGSVYFDPAPGGSGGGGGGGEAAATVQLTYWLLKDVSHGGAGGLDEAVLRAALRWATTAWPFRKVLLPVLGSNTRLKELCQGALKLEPAPAVDGVPAFVYVKDGGAEGGKDEL